MNYMAKVESLFNNNIRPGIYFIDIQLSTDYLSQMAKKHNFSLFYIDGASITDKETFFKKFSSAMKFPDYFGENWDAFDECITDMEWCRSIGYIILYDNFQVFATADPKEFHKALNSFKFGINEWQEENTYMYVLLKGTITNEYKLRIEKLSSVW